MLPPAPLSWEEDPSCLPGGFWLKDPLQGHLPPHAAPRPSPAWMAESHQQALAGLCKHMCPSDSQPLAAGPVPAPERAAPCRSGFYIMAALLTLAVDSGKSFLFPECFLIFHEALFSYRHAGGGPRPFGAGALPYRVVWPSQVLQHRLCLCCLPAGGAPLPTAQRRCSGLRPRPMRPPHTPSCLYLCAVSTPHMLWFTSLRKSLYGVPVWLI